MTGEIGGLAVLVVALLALTVGWRRFERHVHNRYDKPDNVIPFPISNVRYLDSRRRAE